MKQLIYVEFGGNVTVTIQNNFNTYCLALPSAMQSN